ncbi:MAG TPA: His-Xaa-Ser system protein HxsD [Tepidisphaeraceae bacterium]|nr:His-Xaa-Ser system protein HxsD [Tepidisphaeraceae bacterium]
MDVAMGTVRVELELAVYSLAAIKKAAYRLGDRCHVRIATTREDTVVVHLTPKRSIDNARFLAGEFQNELLDQDLREIVAQETEAIRNLLLAQAFSPLVDCDGGSEKVIQPVDERGALAMPERGGN